MLPRVPNMTIFPIFGTKAPFNAHFTILSNSARIFCFPTGFYVHGGEVFRPSAGTNTILTVFPKKVSFWPKIWGFLGLQNVQKVPKMTENDRKTAKFWWFWWIFLGTNMIIWQNIASLTHSQPYITLLPCFHSNSGCLAFNFSSNVQFKLVLWIYCIVFLS